nr:hypothetical protein [Tanacetum cinerariifolium]
MNSDDNHNSGTGVRRQVPLDRKCTYSDFMKSKPLYFKGTEGLVELTQWFERMETVFRITALWKTKSRLPLVLFLEKMTDKYCLRGEIKKLEAEMWNLKVKSTDVVSYNQCFQELALMCVRMFLEESDKIEKFVGSLPDMIHGSTENKRKQDDNQQQENKRQNTSRAYIARPAEKNPYGGSKPLCSKCNYHHDILCAPKCHKCNRVGHLARDCRSPAATNNQRNLTCYECGNQGHYSSDCPELKNQSHRNQAKGIGARRMVHALGGGETNQDLNDMEDDINA